MLSAVLSLMVLAALGWVLLQTQVDPMEPGPGTPRRVALPLAALLLALGVALVLATRRPAAYLQDRPQTRRRILLGALAVLLPCLVVLGASLRFTSAWDAGALESWAYEMATGTYIGDHGDDLLRYPNNHLLLAALTKWYQLCGLLGLQGLGAGAVLLNVLVLAATVVLAYRTACQLCGVRGGLVLLALLVPFVLTSPWIATAYSDTIGMVFPVLVLHLFLRLPTARSDRARAVLWFMIGAVALAGYQVKPTVVFALVAVVIASAIRVVRDHGGRARLRRGVSAGVGLLLGAVAASVAGAALVSSMDFAFTEEEKAVAFPATHWLMMGAQGTGSYSEEDVFLTESWPPDQRVANGIGEYVERVSAMGGVGYLQFLVDKATWVYGDGSFFAYQEAGHASHPIDWDTQDDLSGAVREWLGPHGAHYDVTKALWQGAWIAVLALVVLPAFWWGGGLFAPETMAMRLAVAALTVFLMFFEARSRYLYLYLPVYVLLATVTLLHLARAWESRGAERGAPHREAHVASRREDRPLQLVE